ncbi:hypothetical protein V5799_003587, partial [Amblyomma americanum]
LPFCWAIGNNKEVIINEVWSNNKEHFASSRLLLQGAQGGQPQADSSCSPSSIAEPVCSSSSRTAPAASTTTTANSSTSASAGSSGAVQDCFEDLSTLEELLKIGDKSFDLPAQDASSSSSSTVVGNGPASSNSSSAAPRTASPASRTSPSQHNGTDAAADTGSGLKIVETHSLQSTDPNEDWCSVCHDGGELLCCGSCPRVYHLQCHVPTLGATPSEDWTCLLCLDILKCNIPRESAGSKRKSPVGLSGRELLICERILLHLFCHELSVPFHIPVSRTVPNYYKVITKPMDLTTIKQKLSPSHFNHYEDVPEFLSDVKLIFKNCYTFNHELKRLFLSSEQPASVSIAMAVRDELGHALAPEDLPIVAAADQPSLSYAAAVHRPPPVHRKYQNATDSGPRHREFMPLSDDSPGTAVLQKN